MLNNEETLLAWFADIPTASEWISVEPVNKGWSADRKYCVRTYGGERLMLRVSAGAQADAKRAEYDAVCRVAQLGIRMSMPVAFGLCEGGASVYSLLTWLDGDEAGEVLSALPEACKYELGLEAGRMLRMIHSIPATESQQPWAERFNRKIDRNIGLCRACAVPLPGAERAIDYAQKARHLLDGRPQCLQHGDYHTGNMILSPGQELGIIDFNRWDWGDPWEEFNRITLSSRTSEAFASGQIDGYFAGAVPDAFFALLALYIASNLLGSISWAVPYGQRDVDAMLAIAADTMEQYREFETVVPAWYR